jgi:hypothetical protein
LLRDSSRSPSKRLLLPYKAKWKVNGCCSRFTCACGRGRRRSVSVVKIIQNPYPQA